MFRYASGKMQLTADSDEISNGVDGFGGNGALAGINAGDAITSITVPGSQTPSFINVTQTSNVENPGMWIFQVDGGKRVMWELV